VRGELRSTTDGDRERWPGAINEYMGLNRRALSLRTYFVEVEAESRTSVAELINSRGSKVVGTVESFALGSAI
jgi:hypothetical protein